MGIFGFFKRRSNGKLTDEDREKAAEINSLRFRLRREEMLRQAQLESLRAERERVKLLADINEYKGDDDSDDVTGSFMALLSGALSKGNTPAAPATDVPLIHLSDDELKGIIAKIPKVALKAAKGLSDDALRNLIAQKIGRFDDDTFNRAVLLLRR